MGLLRAAGATLFFGGAAKPRGLPKIDRSHPLAPDGSYTFFDGPIPVDLMRGVPLISSGALGPSNAAGVSAQGTGLQLDGTANSYYTFSEGSGFATSNGAGSGSFTVMLHAAIQPAAAIWDAFQIEDPAHSFQGFEWDFNQTSGGAINAGNISFQIAVAAGNFRRVGWNPPNDGALHVHLVTVDTSTSPLTLTAYIDAQLPGQNQAGTLTAPAGLNSATMQVAGGSGPVTTGTMAGGNVLLSHAVWNRVLTPSEILFVSLNSYCFLTAPEGEFPALFFPSSTQPFPFNRVNRLRRR